MLMYNNFCCLGFSCPSSVGGSFNEKCDCCLPIYKKTEEQKHDPGSHTHARTYAMCGNHGQNKMLHWRLMSFSSAHLFAGISKFLNCWANITRFTPNCPWQGSRCPQNSLELRRRVGLLSRAHSPPGGGRRRSRLIRASPLITSVCYGHRGVSVVGHHPRVTAPAEAVAMKHLDGCYNVCTAGKLHLTEFTQSWY